MAPFGHTSVELGKELCAIFGINPDNVSSLTIKVRVGSPPIVEVERVVKSAEFPMLSHIFDKYELRPIEDKKDESYSVPI